MHFINFYQYYSQHVQELMTFVETKITIFCKKTKLDGFNVRYIYNTYGNKMHTVLCNIHRNRTNELHEKKNILIC